MHDGVDTHRLFDRAIEEAHDWYLAQSPDAAQGFLDAIDSALTTILESPTRWPVIDEGVYRYRLKRYPYHIYYYPTLTGIYVLAVMRTSRDPQRWKRRL